MLVIENWESGLRGSLGPSIAGQLVEIGPPTLGQLVDCRGVDGGVVTVEYIISKLVQMGSSLWVNWSRWVPPGSTGPNPQDPPTLGQLAQVPRGPLSPRALGSTGQKVPGSTGPKPPGPPKPKDPGSTGPRPTSPSPKGPLSPKSPKPKSPKPVPLGQLVEILHSRSTGPGPPSPPNLRAPRSTGL